MVVLDGPDNFVLEYSLSFNFQASNNQEAYEALIAGMKLDKKVGVTHLTSNIDSREDEEKYQTRDSTLLRYLHMAQGRSRTFTEFEINHIPKEENIRADVLARLASTKGPGLNKIVI